jgi:hypothetical protein
MNYTGLTEALVVTPEKVLIYHGGTGKIVFLGVLRTATLFICGASTMIIAPAFFADEFPAYLAPLSKLFYAYQRLNY